MQVGESFIRVMNRLCVLYRVTGMHVQEGGELYRVVQVEK